MAGTIHYKLGLDGSSLSRGFALAGGAVTGFLGKAARLGALAGSLIGVGSAAMAMKGAIEGAAEMESTEVAFASLTGSAKRAQTTLESLKQFASSTPFEFPEIADAAKKLIAFGTRAADVTDELRMVGDIASAVGAPLGELAEIYGKARTSGRLFAEDVNQLTGRGIPITAELAKQFGVTTAEVRGLVETGKVGFPQLELAFKSLTAEGGRFFGMTAAQSKTALGLWSTFKDGINEALREFGKPVLGSLKVLLTDAIGKTDVLVAKAKEWGAAVGTGIAVAYKLFQSGQLGTAIKAGLKVAFGEAINFLVKALIDGVIVAAKIFGTAVASGIKAAISGGDVGGAISDAVGAVGKSQPVVNTTMAKLEFMAAIGPALAEVKAAQKAAADAIAAQPDPGEEAPQPAAVELPAAKDKSKPASIADSLAKIGGYVGGGGPAGQRHAADTAKNTARAAKSLDTIARRMSNGGTF